MTRTEADISAQLIEATTGFINGTVSEERFFRMTNRAEAELAALDAEAEWDTPVPYTLTPKGRSALLGE